MYISNDQYIVEIEGIYFIRIHEYDIAINNLLKDAVEEKGENCIFTGSIFRTN